MKKDLLRGRFKRDCWRILTRKEDLKIRISDYKLRIDGVQEYWTEVNMNTGVYILF